MEANLVRNKDTLKILRLRWFGLALVSLAGLAGIFGFLVTFWDQAAATRWLVASLGVTLLFLWTLWTNLSTNHRKGEQLLLPRLGAGNSLTFLRGLFIAATAGFLLSPQPEDELAILPAAFYTLATLGDFFDGFLARRQDHITYLGETLDMYVDAIGVLAATLLLVQFDKVPTWYLLVGLARYLFLAGIKIRQRMGKPIRPLPDSDTRRALAAVQMNLILVSLWPLFSPPATMITAAVFSIPFLLNFLRDWFIVSGKIAPGFSQPDWLRVITSYWLPLILRLAIFFFAITPTFSRPQSSIPQLDPSAFPGLAGQVTVLLIPVVLHLIIPLLLLVGFAGRIVAIAGLLTIGISQNFTPLTEAQVLLLIMFVTMLHLGTGPFSLWRPEDRLISLRAGQRVIHTASQQVTSESKATLGASTATLREAS